MIELPESFTLACQLNQTLLGKRVSNVTANASPHKFAWYFGDPDGYQALLSGKTITRARAVGGMVEIRAEDAVLLFGDGVNLRYRAPAEPFPQKHQLWVEFEDFSSLVATVQMYGGLWAFPEGANDSPYYRMAREKPSPLSEEFTEGYFYALMEVPGAEKLSIKALLATEQRIPGLGNGVLQDILWRARVHPKCKVKSLNPERKEKLYHALRETVGEMAIRGGRDTERDLFGCLGGYRTAMSKNSLGTACPACGETIQKQAYLGGSIYFCPRCQPEE